MLQAPLLTDFSAGELSPKLSGRSDLPAYIRGCLELENWVPFSQGGVTTRPGTKYLGVTDDSGEEAVIYPFVIDNDTAFILEFTPLKLRYWQSDAIVGGGTPTETATPYATIAHIRELKFAQDGNKLFIMHRSYAPKILTWTTPATFSLDTMAVVGNAGRLPFQSAGNYPGTVAFYKGRAYFGGSTNEPQKIWATRPYVYAQGDPWQATTPYEVNQVVSNDSGKLYRCVTKGTSAVSGGPTGTGTGITDGTCEWDYWCLVGNLDFTYFDTISYTVKQLKDVADWADPDVPELEEITTYKDIIADDNAMEFEIASERCDEILDMIAGNFLVVGTVSSEYVIPDNVTALNVAAKMQTRYGFKSIHGILVNGSILYLQRYGTRLREYAYSDETQAYQSPDLTYQADHILSDGVGAVDMDYALVPEPMVYLTRSDGEMAVLLHNPAYNVSAWFRFVDGGSGEYESVAVIPGTTEDAVYVIINRGGTRCLERFDKLFDNDSIPLDGWETTTISGATESGLDRFDGLDVTIYNTTDSTVHTATVSGGSITYPAGDGVGDTVYIGMAFTAKLKTMRVPTQGEYGTGQMQYTRIGRVRVRCLNSYPFKVGYANTASLLSEAAITGPYTGDVKCEFNGDWTMDNWVMIVQDEPYHTTILAIVPEIEG